MNSTLLVILLTNLGAGSTVAPTHEPTPEATQVVARHLEATGGIAAIEAAPSVTISGTLTMDGLPSPFTLQIKSPECARFVCVIADRKTIQARDAHARFWQQDAGGVHDLKSSQTRELMEWVLALSPTGQARLGERLVDALCERTMEHGRSSITLGRNEPPGPLPALTFDDATGLLVRIGHCRLLDYRPAGPLKMPHRILCESKTELLIHSIGFNDIPSATFERPSPRGGWLSYLAPGLGSPAPQLHTLRSSPGTLEIVRRPPPTRIDRGRLTRMAAYDRDSGANWQIDLRGADLTRLNLGGRLSDLLHADFDSNTRWPAKLPVGFNPNQVLRMGQDPGLGVRALHVRGITGKNVGIGIIDQTLLVDHGEYAGQLRLYEEIHSPAGAAAQMHGPAVASIAVGRTCGVAPAADLYYIAQQHGTFVPGQEFEWDFTSLAQSIDRLLDLNKTLPDGRRIRVISISVGWTKDQKGYSETMAAVQRASDEGVFVISTSLGQTHNLVFDGLGRDALDDPDVPSSYGPGTWWAAQFWSGHRRFKPGRRLCVPMDNRSTASPTGPHDYVHYAGGGWSWCVPWVAGLYALACQVDPAITPGRFWAEALSTGTTITVHRDGEDVELGTLANPVALLERLSSSLQ